MVKQTVVSVCSQFPAWGVLCKPPPFWPSACVCVRQQGDTPDPSPAPRQPAAPAALAAAENRCQGVLRNRLQHFSRAPRRPVSSAGNRASRDPPPLPPPFPGPGFWEPFRHHRASKAQALPHQRLQNPDSPVTFHLHRGSPLPFSPGFRGNKDPLSP